MPEFREPGKGTFSVRHEKKEAFEYEMAKHIPPKNKEEANHSTPGRPCFPGPDGISACLHINEEAKCNSLPVELIPLCDTLYVRDSVSCASAGDVSCLDFVCRAACLNADSVTMVTTGQHFEQTLGPRILDGFSSFEHSTVIHLSVTAAGDAQQFYSSRAKHELFSSNKAEEMYVKTGRDKQLLLGSDVSVSEHRRSLGCGTVKTNEGTGLIYRETSQDGHSEIDFNGNQEVDLTTQNMHFKANIDLLTQELENELNDCLKQYSEESHGRNNLIRHGKEETNGNGICGMTDAGVTTTALKPSTPGGVADENQHRNGNYPLINHQGYLTSELTTTEINYCNGVHGMQQKEVSRGRTSSSAVLKLLISDTARSVVCPLKYLENKEHDTNRGEHNKIETTTEAAGTEYSIHKAAKDEVTVFLRAVTPDLTDCPLEYAELIQEELTADASLSKAAEDNSKEVNDKRTQEKGSMRDPALSLFSAVNDQDVLDLKEEHLPKEDETVNTVLCPDLFEAIFPSIRDLNCSSLSPESDPGACLVTMVTTRAMDSSPAEVRVQYDLHNKGCAGLPDSLCKYEDEKEGKNENVKYEDDFGTFEMAGNQVQWDDFGVINDIAHLNKVSDQEETPNSGLKQNCRPERVSVAFRCQSVGAETEAHRKWINTSTECHGSPQEQICLASSIPLSPSPTSNNSWKAFSDDHDDYIVECGSGDFRLHKQGMPECEKKGQWWPDNATEEHFLGTPGSTPDKLNQNLDSIFHRCFPSPPVLGTDEDIPSLEQLITTEIKNRDENKDTSHLFQIWVPQKHICDALGLTYKWAGSRCQKLFHSSLHIDPSKKITPEKPLKLLDYPSIERKTEEPLVVSFISGCGQKELTLAKSTTPYMQINGFSPSHRLQTFFQQWTQTDGRRRLKKSYDINENLLV